MRVRLAPLLLVLSVACTLPMEAPPPAGDAVPVERVVDGDTLIVVVAGERLRVRLIGIDTPEVVKPGAPVECFGPEASAEAHRLLDGQQVRLAYDRQRLDRFGRTLAYVYRARDDLFVNLELVRAGFARALRIEPDTAHASDFARAERDAQSARRGLWSACPD